MGFLKQYGHRLVDMGYEIVPIKKGKKAPVLPGWQEIRATHDDVDAWAANGHRDGGIGVLCRQTIAVDIDCHDKKLNYDLIHWLQENVGQAPIRVGKKPKCIMPFRVEDGFTKIRSSEFEDAEGSKHAVEILADGQQFVAFGIHPQTNQPYAWVNGISIADTPWQKLPVITKVQAKAFVDYFERRAAERGWELVRKGVEAVQHDPDDLSHLRPKLDATVQEMAELLERLDPDAHHDDWIKIGMALHHQFDGGDDGLELWDDWSARGEKYVEGECARRWNTFDSSSKTPVTAAFIKRQELELAAEEVREEKLPEMLKHWAFVQVEGSARVIREDIHSAAIVLYKLEDLKKEYQNCRILADDGGKPKMVNLVDLWLEHAERRTYPAGLTFAPDSEVLSKYNLWRGWSYEPVEGDVGPWLDFITDVVADGNVDHANYIIAWCAQIIQQPLTKVGVGLVLRGRKGTGKTKFGELLGGLVKAHHKIVSRAEHVTGNFNRHLEDTLILQADEAFWAGAKSSEGALKDLLTNPEITIERKGVDAYTAPNYTRVLFTSNEDWVVPASLDERRFAVFDVSTCRQQDAQYFAAIDRWYFQGGAGAIMHYLQNFELANVNVRVAPATQALADQKLESLGTIDSWLLSCLQNGEIREHRVAGDKVEWGDDVPKAQLYDIYVSSVRGRYESPVKEVAFWKHLRGCDGLLLAETQKRVGESRVRCVKLAMLRDARLAFEVANRLTLSWPTVDAGDPLDPANWDDEPPF
jgi:hypothetical protein